MYRTFDVRHRTFDALLSNGPRVSTERLIKAHRTFHKSIERLILSDMHIDRKFSRDQCIGTCIERLILNIERSMSTPNVP
jgi:hypothetical protein